MGAPARDMALAKLATAAARTDSSWAGRIALAVTGRPGQAPGQGRPQREQPPPSLMLTEPDQAMYWKVRALTEIAIATAGADPDRPARPDDAERFPRSATAEGTVRDVAQTTAETAADQNDPDQAGQLLAAADQWARAIGKSDLQAMALTSVKVAEAQIDPDHAGQLLTEAEQYAHSIGGASARSETLGAVALAAARTSPAQAEQVIGGLPPDAPMLAEVAMVAAHTDPACAERIAGRSADRYLQGLVGAVIAIRADPATAGPRLDQAVAAAGNDPARVAEIAVVAARADPDRAEQSARGIKAGGGMTAGYWRARILAGLADACLGDTSVESRIVGDA